MSRLRIWYANTVGVRVDHSIQLFVYVFTAVAGIVAILHLPITLIKTIGRPLVTVFGIFGLTGSTLAVIGIVVGFKVAERVGIILLLTALLQYIFMLIYGPPGVPIAMFFAGGLFLSFVQRLLILARKPTP